MQSYEETIHFYAHRVGSGIIASILSRSVSPESQFKAA